MSLPRSLLVAALSVMLAGAPAWAQGEPEGEAAPLGQGSGVAPGVGEAAAEVEPGVVEGEASYMPKLREEQPLSVDEFLAYLRDLEADERNQQLWARNRSETAQQDYPTRLWAMLVTRLHDFQYGRLSRNMDDRRTRVMGIPLFVDGSENQGWEDIHAFEVRSPKYLIDPDGETLDLGHAYAGVAALIMRDRWVTGRLMSRVNTGWGDSLQVASGRIEGAWGMLTGIFTPAEDFDDARRQFSEAPDFKPEDQKLGNALGVQARRYLGANREDDLSKAFEHALQRIYGEE